MIHDALKFSYTMVKFATRRVSRLHGGMSLKRLLIAGLIAQLVLPVILLLLIAAFNAVVVALVWNGGVRRLSGVAPLSFVPCMVIGCLLLCFGV